MGSTTLLMSVGPAPAELDRVQDFMAALRRWEPMVRSVVFIDDALEPRGLGERFSAPGDIAIHSLPHPRKGEGSGVWGGLAEGILLGMDWIAEHDPEARMLLKIDTDALPIGPFAAKAAALFAAHPRTGLIGLYDRHCSGEPREFAPWDRALFNYALPIGIRWRAASWRHKASVQFLGLAGAQRRILWQARANGYRWGEHCLGGAYLLRAETLRDFRENGFLRNPHFWRSTQISEDALIGAYVKAAGWELRGSAAAGEIFGLAHRGLPYPPEELAARGYSIIHAVKNDPHCPEDSIREFFRQRF